MNQVVQFTFDSKFFLFDVHEIEEISKFFEADYDEIRLVPDVFMAFQRNAYCPVNILATRILVDLNLFEVKNGFNYMEQAVSSNVFFYRKNGSKLANTNWDEFCRDWIFFFRCGDLLPYNMLEKHVRITLDWVAILGGEIDRMKELWELLCCGRNQRLEMRSHDKVVGALLAIILRRLEPGIWSKHRLDQLFV